MCFKMRRVRTRDFTVVLLSDKNPKVLYRAIFGFILHAGMYFFFLQFIAEGNCELYVGNKLPP